MLLGSMNIKGDEPFLQDGSQTVLHVESLGHGLHAFINGKLAGSWKQYIYFYIYIQKFLFFTCPIVLL